MVRLQYDNERADWSSFSFSASYVVFASQQTASTSRRGVIARRRSMMSRRGLRSGEQWSFFPFNLLLLHFRNSFHILRFLGFFVRLFVQLAHCRWLGFSKAFPCFVIR